MVMVSMTPTDPAAFLRLMVNTQLAMGMIAPAFAEQALAAVDALAQQAQVAQQAAALAQAMTPSAQVAHAPTLKHEAKGDASARHRHYLTNGRPPQIRESAAERRAREQAASIGYVR